MENLTDDLILSAFLVFVRVAALVMTAPFFSYGAFPRQIRLYFAVVTTIVMFNSIPAEDAFVSFENDNVFLLQAILLEMLVGIALGLVGRLVFAGLELAGTLISLNTALSFANMVDASNQQQSMILSNLFSMLAILVFLSIDGDKMYLSALAKSFQVVPVQQANIHLAGPFMLEIATYLFVIGVQIASPFIVVLFLIDVSLAIFARVMPQANLMFIALTVKFGVGIAILIMAIPYMPTAFEMMFTHISDFLVDLLTTIVPGIQ